MTYHIFAYHKRQPTTPEESTKVRSQVVGGLRLILTRGLLNPAADVCGDGGSSSLF